MNWQRLGKILAIDQVFAGVHIAGHWIFRTAQDIISSIPESSTIRWTINLGSHQNFLGSKKLVSIGSLVVTVEDFGYASPLKVTAIESKNGKVVWKTQVKGKISQSGLAIFSNSIWLHIEQKNNNFQLLQLSSSDGSIQTVIPSEATNGIETSTNRLFIPSWSGLYVIDETNSVPRRLTSSHSQSLSSRGNAVYFYDISTSPTEPLKVCYLDATLERVVGQVECLNGRANVECIFQLSKPGHVVVLHGLGFIILDLQQQDVVATVELSEGHQTLSIAWTPNGLALAHLMPDGECRVTLYDEKTGEIIGELPVAEISPALLFYIDEHLIVSGLGGLQFFVWNNRLLKAENSDNTSLSESPTVLEDSTNVTVSVPRNSDLEDEDNLGQEGEERTIQREYLEELIDLFVSCMQADTNSQEHVEFGKQFNSLLNSYLQEFQDESVATFAFRISKMDIPYEEALQDVIYVRGLGQ